MDIYHQVSRFMIQGLIYTIDTSLSTPLSGDQGPSSGKISQYPKSMIIMFSSLISHVHIISSYTSHVHSVFPLNLPLEGPIPHVQMHHDIHDAPATGGHFKAPHISVVP